MGGGDDDVSAMQAEQKKQMDEQQKQLDDERKKNQSRQINLIKRIQESGPTGGSSSGNPNVLASLKSRIGQ